MNLGTAQRYAEKIVTWLMPCCEKIRIAGSIRRERPECGDVDIVCIPKVEVQRDMLGAVISARNAVWRFLDAYVAESGGKATWLAGGNKETGQNYLVQLPKTQLDVFCATPETWGTVLLCRTGSKEHNIWLAERAKRMGGHWNPYRYLTVHGKVQDVSAEDFIYAALDLPFILPQEREQERLREIDRGG